MKSSPSPVPGRNSVEKKKTTFSVQLQTIHTVTLQGLFFSLAARAMVARTKQILKLMVSTAVAQLETKKNSHRIGANVSGMKPCHDPRGTREWQPLGRTSWKKTNGAFRVAFCLS